MNLSFGQIRTGQNSRGNAGGKFSILLKKHDVKELWQHKRFK